MSQTAALLLALSLTACAHRGPAELDAPAPVTRDSTASPDGSSPIPSRELMVPVDGIAPDRVPDTYLARRGDRPHSALDIAAPRGTPVLSADSGVVWKIRSNALGGLTVYVLDLAEEFVHYYAHLGGYREGLQEGERVTPGDVLGYVGTTGNAPPNVPHLHYQVLRYGKNGRWWDGEPINPHRALRHAGRATSR